MKTVGLICEFNPFHHGHAHLLRSIRERFGDDTAIVCVMGGNFVQRGEPAIFDKWSRAEAAVLSGADLTLELPFPWSAASADRFADAAVSVLDSLGIVDHLAFGSESGDLTGLSLLASELESPRFLEAYTSFSNENNIGSAEKTSVVYREIYGKTDRLSFLKKPNDLLGVSYIRAILRKHSKIDPVAFLRVGTPHDGKAPSEDSPITSASEARALIKVGGGGQTAAFSRMPCSSIEIFKREISAGKYLADDKKWLDLLLFHCRLTDQRTLEKADGLGGGLAARVKRAANDSCEGMDFFNRIRTKKYTNAFLRRALLAALFGITKEQLNASPSYTQILAFNKKGQALLSRIRRTAALPLLTKPADYRLLPLPARESSLASARADAVYASLLLVPSAPSEARKRSPYRRGNRSQTNPIWEGKFLP